MSFPWLTILGLLPIAGGLALFLPLKGASRWLGMFFALLTLLVGLGVAGVYATDPAALTVQAPRAWASRWC